METFGRTGHVSSMVLVVENDPDIRMILVDILEEEGHSGYACASTDDALALLDGDTPRVLITDVDGLGQIDGLAFAVELRRRRPNQPVVVITGGDYADAADRFGFQFVPKPFTLEYMLRILVEMLAPQSNLLPA